MIPATAAPDPVSAGTGRWRIAGRWFHDADGSKVFLRGVTYGPFKPGANGAPWSGQDTLLRDFQQIARMGFNTVRIYEMPDEMVLQAAAGTGLRLLVGVPWTQHVDFLSQPGVKKAAVARVEEAARCLAHHPAVAGMLVGNEIEKTLVRWLGPEAVRGFLEDLISRARREAPDLPLAYATYPSTEYLIPRNADFVAFNVFLEEARSFESYLKRLQVLADGKPLVISEFGLDSRAHGEDTQAQVFAWQDRIARDSAVAGNFWFAFTDEWHRGGEEVTGWQFGLVTREREPKLAGRQRLQQATCPAPLAKAPTPRFSVVVCTRNGALTLRNCLAALARQNYPDYEVLVIDDGSTDETPAIAREFPLVHYHRQAPGGLSAARNHGMRLATGDILAYTDDDCIPDEDWLKYLAPAFDNPAWVAAGGPNLPPPPRNLTEACVAAAPGAPAHVLVGDEVAEHLPGCNLAIRKSALAAIGGFREEFTTAGDDVDVCWRLQEGGGSLRFVPAAVVWHHRRFTVRAYLRQQTGYGLAEALLMKHFPRRFAWFGGARWRGAIYGDELHHDSLKHRAIHFGVMGQAPFQCIYAGIGSPFSHWMSGLPWHLTWVSALALGLLHPLWLLLPLGMLLMSLQVATHRAAVNDFMLISHGWRHRVLLGLLCFIQPVVRDWARLKGMCRHRALPQGKLQWPLRGVLPSTFSGYRGPQLAFWSETGTGREAWLDAFTKTMADTYGLRCRTESAWSLWDGRIKGLCTWARHVTVTEYHGGGRCLTRLKVSIWSPTLLLLAGCLVTLALLWNHADLKALAFLVFLMPITVCLVDEILLAKRYRAAALQAAREVGLTPVSHKRPLSLDIETVPMGTTALDSR